jgi:hypothetical protein
MQLEKTVRGAANDGPHPEPSAREPSSDLETGVALCEPTELTQLLQVALEAEIVTVFAQPPVAGEPRELTFKRKEQQLAALFAQLVPADSLTLERRLRLATPRDPIAAQFARLIATRRSRLLAFLGASRKRHPLQLARETPQEVAPGEASAAFTSAGRR